MSLANGSQSQPSNNIASKKKYTEEDPEGDERAEGKRLACDIGSSVTFGR